MKKRNPLFAIIADDNTGASDAGGMLTERGIRTLLVLDEAWLEQKSTHDKMLKSYDTLILSTASRSSPREKAYEKTARAALYLRQLGVKKIQVKYSSTFDSTEKGNIGPSLDAAMDILKDDLRPFATTVSPALPVNGRTTYFGYHFVKGILISESPLRHHPLNPITDPSLVRWLRKQTKRKVGLAPLPVIRQGAETLRSFLRELAAKGTTYIVTDTIEQSDLKTIAMATKDWMLISGASGITAEIPDLMFGKREHLDFSERLEKTGGRLIVAAGSCTPKTISQNDYALAAGFSGLELDAKKILEGSLDVKSEVRRFIESTPRSANIIIYSSAEHNEVEEVKKLGLSMGLSVGEIGERISDALSDAILAATEYDDFGRLCISGGETSGAVCRKLGIKTLEVGLPIEPGVPFCFSTGEKDEEGELMVVLKSGNFGSIDFYEKVSGL